MNSAILWLSHGIAVGPTAEAVACSYVAAHRSPLDLPPWPLNTTGFEPYGLLNTAANHATSQHITASARLHLCSAGGPATAAHTLYSQNTESSEDN